jgi:hypothetical protein
MAGSDWEEDGDVRGHGWQEGKVDAAAQHGINAWQPSVGFGLTLIASAVVLFFSVARPESQVYLHTHKHNTHTHTHTHTHTI